MKLSPTPFARIGKYSIIGVTLPINRLLRRSPHRNALHATRQQHGSSTACASRRELTPVALESSFLLTPVADANLTSVGLGVSAMEQGVGHQSGIFGGQLSPTNGDLQLYSSWRPSARPGYPTAMTKLSKTRFYKRRRCFVCGLSKPNSSTSSLELWRYVPICIAQRVIETHS